MDKPETISFTRRNLPHWRVAGRPYFVTFRLKGSVPQSLLQELARQRKLADQSDDEASLNLHRLLFQKLEQCLDQPDPTVAWLRDAEIAQIVADAFDWAESECGWRVPAYVVMPNHVHALFAEGDGVGRALSKTLGVMKGFTAYRANRVLGRTGEKFWQAESVDHWCRSSDKEEAVIRYIRNNPVKSGLVCDYQDWPWLKVP